MSTTALVVALIGCVGIIVVGLRFLLVPDRPIRDFGLPTPTLPAFATIKGIRDITSGVVLLVVALVAGREALGWGLLAVAMTPIGDMVVVLAHGGRPAAAFGIHGLTAAVLVAAGLVLALA